MVRKLQDVRAQLLRGEGRQQAALRRAGGVAGQEDRGVAEGDVQNAALKKGVAVTAGDPFYEFERDVPTIRLNFSNGSDEYIEKGIRILGEVIKEFMK